MVDLGDIGNEVNMLDKRNIVDKFDRLPVSSVYWDLKRVQDRNRNLQVTNFLGRDCLAFTVSPGDKRMDGGNGKFTERTELGETRDFDLPFQTPVVYKFDVAVPPDFVISDNRLVFAQWKHTNSDQSPPVSLRYESGKLVVGIKNDKEGIIKQRFDYELRDRWTHFETELFLTDGDQSVVKVRVDDREIFDFTGKTGFTGEDQVSEFHLGVYRDAVAHSDTIFFSNFERVLLS